MTRVRVYELAKEFGVESKAVMAKLQEMGYFVRSASSTIEAPVVHRLKEAFAIEYPSPETIEYPSPGIDETHSEAEDVTEELWLPLNMRLGGTPPQRALQNGVPAALVQPLRDWIYSTAKRGGDGTVRRTCLRLNLVLPGIRPDKNDPEEARLIFLAYDTPREGLLEIADAMLELIYQVNKPLPPPPNPVNTLGSGVPGPQRQGTAWPQSPAPRPGPRPGPQMPATRWNHIAAAELQELLTDVRSVYYVKDNTRGLERDPNTAGTTEANEVFRSAASTIYGLAAEHLQAARDALDTLRPDPVKAYSEAIKAVEAAGHGIIEPDNALPTLGTMIKEIRDNPAQFSLTISGRPEALRQMMALLWFGQTARHGGKAYRPETQEQAEMAITLAATLVEWFLSGKIQRQSQSTVAETPAGRRRPRPHGTGADTVTSNSTPSTSATGSLASDEALAALREKLSGGQS
jgi:hypothetical protein